MNLLNVSGVYRQEGSSFVVKDISFSQRYAQKLAIAGETGSGKSTLMKMVGGLVQPTRGTVFFEKQKGDWS